LDEERETAAQDQGHRYKLNTSEKYKPLFQKPKEYPTSAEYESLWDKGLVRIMFKRGHIGGFEYVMRADIAEEHIKMGRAVSSDNQRRVRQA
jgi:hypothetical protein